MVTMKMITAWHRSLAKICLIIGWLTNINGWLAGLFWLAIILTYNDTMVIH